MELGYYKGKISGNYLGGTQKSVRDFQEKNGLSVTGAADPLTQEALYSLRAVGNGDSPDATRTPVPDLSGYLVDDDDTAARNGVVMPDSSIPFTTTLKSGSGGSLVKQLQQRLTDLGYYTGPVSGNFAKQTLRAVKAVQTQNGIKVSGVVDEETWDVIFNDTHIVMPDATPKPSPTPEPVPFAMTVDVTNQVTTVYGRDENGEYTVSVRRMLLGHQGESQRRGRLGAERAACQMVRLPHLGQQLRPLLDADQRFHRLPFRDLYRGKPGRDENLQLQGAGIQGQPRMRPADGGGREMGV